MIRKLKDGDKIVCDSCNGTGLYQGMGERNGAAVICTTCNGQGYTVFAIPEKEIFEELKINPKITRVFKNSFGYVHTSEDYTTKEGNTIHFSEGGCTYDEWLHGVDPKPVKDQYCPLIWVRQDKNKFNSTALYDKCEEALLCGDTISKCKHWKNKHECWELYNEK